MRISIITIGTKMPPWVSQGVDEYSKRMPRELKVEWKELPLAPRGKTSNSSQLKSKRGSRYCALYRQVTG